jgi:uncharacterized glyoxalase superfamily protein PhnB
MIGIVAKDMERSLQFYALLGVPVPEANHVHIECVLPNGLRLAWDSEAMVREMNDAWTEPIGHRMGLAFLCESPQAVDELYAKVVDAGFAGYREPWDAFWGQRYAQVEDPDGNVVDLFAPLAVEA